ncbi:rhodanese-like domain-containing protein [Actinoplanes sp. NPDC049802]|uniref:rhodanese-like domain-containing protein n=1 Tax=Actinoplanes sp. NPDC049802 TaxID=3154742 RepID=UPI0033D20805
MINFRRSMSGGVALVAAVLLATGCSTDEAQPERAAPTGVSAPATVADNAQGRVSPADFATAIARPGIVLLDVRTAEEFAGGHLAGAINLDVEAADFATRVAELDRSKSYAVYCRTGRRSGVAAEQLHAAGVTEVIDLDGGVTAWTASGRALTTG